MNEPYSKCGISSYSREVSLISSHTGSLIYFILCRHVNMDFWPTFCAKAGVFCIGEVFGSDIECVFLFLVTPPRVLTPCSKPSLILPRTSSFGFNSTIPNVWRSHERLRTSWPPKYECFGRHDISKQAEIQGSWFIGQFLGEPRFTSLGQH